MYGDDNSAAACLQSVCAVCAHLATTDKLQVGLSLQLLVTTLLTAVGTPATSTPACV